MSKEKEKNKNPKEQKETKETKETKEHFDLKSDKEGFLHKLQSDKKDWQKLYFRLAGGSLYYYSNEKPGKAKGVFQLKDVKFEAQTFNKKNAIVLNGQEKSLVISVTDASQSNVWLDALKAGASKQPISFPLKDESKSGVLFKAKKNFAGKAATSSLGKSVIKKILDDELKQLIACVKNIIAIESGSKELADRLEHNTMKITLKSYFLWENKTVSIDEFKKLEIPLKQALRLLLAVYDNAGKIRDENFKAQVFDEKFTVVAVLLDNVKELLITVLQPHLTAKSIARIPETFDKVASRDFLLHAWTTVSLKPDVDFVMNFVRRYVQNKPSK